MENKAQEYFNKKNVITKEKGQKLLNGNYLKNTCFGSKKKKRGKKFLFEKVSEKG